MGLGPQVPRGSGDAGLTLFLHHRISLRIYYVQDRWSSTWCTPPKYFHVVACTGARHQSTSMWLRTLAMHATVSLHSCPHRLRRASPCCHLLHCITSTHHHLSAQFTTLYAAYLRPDTTDNLSLPPSLSLSLHIYMYTYMRVDGMSRQA